ncbi:helix-turn-helix domain-containing protein [Streptomyces rimosus]|uniref:helix-turn-helix domain-containing protein n=1 Tax=Streptomyces rimosus TaxID=1927 RepID=UPI0037D17BFE
MRGVVRRYTTGLCKIGGSRPLRFTIIGNHLAQHRRLSATAIGIATYVQSLPDGTPVDIRTLARRFPEGRDRISAALRELEKYGYIKRVKERLESGTFVTVTYSYANPEPAQEPDAAGTPAACETASAPRLPGQRPPKQRKRLRAPGPRAAPPSEPPPAPPPRPPTPPQPPTDPPPPAAPQPPPAAVALLADLRKDDPRLLLSTRDVRRLAPDAAVWLEHGASAEAARRVLSADLPETLHNPAAFIAHRLRELLPPPLPRAPEPPRALPMQNCPDCDHAFRAAEPGLCNPCRREREAPPEPDEPHSRE